MVFNIQIKTSLLILFIILFPTVAFSHPPLEANIINLNADIVYRVDELKWSIAGDVSGNNPNVLSELSWDNLQIRQISLHASLDAITYKTALFCPHFSIKGAYGFIYNGNNQDSDYYEDNRTLEYSRTNNSANNGNTLDLSIGVGPKFLLWNNNITLIPMVGYSYHEQNLTLQDGSQTIPAVGPYSGPYSGLDSTYSAEWKGYWLGIDSHYKLNQQITLKLRAEYHQVNYYADANWNLINTFSHPKSFDHHAKGSGNIYEFGIYYKVMNKILISASYTYQKWMTKPGRDRVYLKNGNTIDTMLNSVKLNSSSLHIGLNYQF